ANADQPTIVLVVGAEGEPEFGKQFNEWAGRWERAAEKAEAKLVRVEEKEALQRLLTAEAKGTTAPLWLVPIGHGTFDGWQAKFNLAGPDGSDRDLADGLKACSRPLAIVNCSSSSGPFLKTLAAPGRVVITATRSGHELNYSRFGDYFSAAIIDPSADL